MTIYKQDLAPDTKFIQLVLMSLCCFYVRENHNKHTRNTFTGRGVKAKGLYLLFYSVALRTTLFNPFEVEVRLLKRGNITTTRWPFINIDCQRFLKPEQSTHEYI